MVGYREHANMKSCRTIRPNCAGQRHRWSDQTPRPFKMKLMITQMRNRIELANLVAQLVEVVPLIHAATPHAYAIHVGCGCALQQSFEALIEHSPIETIPAVLGSKT